MKKVVLFFLIILSILPIMAKAQNNDLNIYLFYGDGCPHCEKEKTWLNDYLENHDNIKLYCYEVWYNENNILLWKQVQEELNIEATGIPYLVIGNDVIQGYLDNYTGDRIESYIDYYLKTNFDDKVGVILGIKKTTTIDGKNEKVNNESYTIPILGKINAKTVSLPLLAIIIGLVDGFNPCAMWILIFLISMLLGMKNRKKMWILGLAFLFTSAFVYFLFMISWLNLAMFINKISIIRIIIAIVAFTLGLINIFKYLKTADTGCEVTNSKSRKKIIGQIKNIVTNNKFILSLTGIVLLAISVNIIELLCSLGLPVLFTEILSVNELSKFSYIIYIVIYIIFFLLDDIIVFTIAMKTLKISAISNKYSKYSHLVGGIIMALIGLLMILKPEWLTFNF